MPEWPGCLPTWKRAGLCKAQVALPPPTILHGVLSHFFSFVLVPPRLWIPKSHRWPEGKRKPGKMGHVASLGMWGEGGQLCVGRSASACGGLEAIPWLPGCEAGWFMGWGPAVLGTQGLQLGIVVQWAIHLAWCGVCWALACPLEEAVEGIPPTPSICLPNHPSVCTPGAWCGAWGMTEGRWGHMEDGVAFPAILSLVSQVLPEHTMQMGSARGGCGGG